MSDRQLAQDLITGCNHVNLLVDDLAAAEHFYGTVLGFEALPRPGISGTGAWFRIGTLQLHLSVVGTPNDERLASN
ncbi:MAG TPA: VOC family protein, partial [Ilumatobacteraceae bacterium]|nr:VOC family protein [Ilumatobacteraceae bacterium]